MQLAARDGADIGRVLRKAQRSGALKQCSHQNPQYFLHLISSFRMPRLGSSSIHCLAAFPQAIFYILHVVSTS